MAYPGLTFAIMVGVAIGTAIYYYFNQENNQQQQHRQNQYYYDDYDANDFASSDLNNQWSGSRASSSGYFSQRRRRRNSSSKCSICLDDINKGKIKTISECGHEFHEHCITMWFRQSKNCPNCRQPVLS